MCVTNKNKVRNQKYFQYLPKFPYELVVVVILGLQNESNLSVLKVDTN